MTRCDAQTERFHWKPLSCMLHVLRLSPHVSTSKITYLYRFIFLSYSMRYFIHSQYFGKTLAIQPTFCSRHQCRDSKISHHYPLSSRTLCRQIFVPTHNRAGRDGRLGNGHRPGVAFKEEIDVVHIAADIDQVNAGKVTSGSHICRVFGMDTNKLETPYTTKRQLRQRQLPYDGCSTTSTPDSCRRPPIAFLMDWAS